MIDAPRINAAIRQCLPRCYVSQTPLPCLAEFVTDLRADPTWRDADILEVEVAVRQMLKGLVVDPNSDIVS
jgi:hypothetical protein